MRKKLYIFIFLLSNSGLYAPEFKGQTMAIPRIAQETPRATAYDEFIPSQQQNIPEPTVVVPEIGNLRVIKSIENDEPGYRSSVFDSPAMSR